MSEWRRVEHLCLGLTGRDRKDGDEKEEAAAAAALTRELQTAKYFKTAPPANRAPPPPRFSSVRFGLVRVISNFHLFNPRLTKDSYGIDHNSKIKMPLIRLFG